MYIGIIADSHDNLNAVSRMLEIFNKMKVDAVLHAGDYIAPFTVKKFIGKKWEFHGVFGNNDGERKGISDITPDIVDGPLLLTFDKRVFCVVHDREEWNGEECDVLIFGHTHKCYYRKTESRMEINPGGLGGWLSGKSTAAVCNSENLDVEIIEVL
jgi:putative phosphoesterase